MFISSRNALTAAAAAVLSLSVAGCSEAAGESGHHHADTSSGLSKEGLGGPEHHFGSSGLSKEVRDELSAAKAATGSYHDPQQARDDGYALPPAPAPLHECISAGDGHGAMGLHHIKAENLDATLSADAPEVVIYAPDKDGRLRLVALEYVVFEDAWKKAGHGDATPRLFGRNLTYVGAGNAYELPAFYQIHAWVWKNNPTGMFADHNPRVSCSTDDG